MVGSLSRGERCIRYFKDWSLKIFPIAENLGFVKPELVGVKILALGGMAEVSRKKGNAQKIFAHPAFSY